MKRSIIALSVALMMAGSMSAQLSGLLRGAAKPATSQQAKPQEETIYNKLVTAEQNVQTAWSGVENHYQMRMQLIPGLVNMVKGLAKQEKETYIGIAEGTQRIEVAAQKAQQVSQGISPKGPTADQMAAYQAAQNELTHSISVVVESYPELRTDKSFIRLMDELSSVNYEIRNSRTIFNEMTNNYNKLLLCFPANIIGALYGFQKKPYFAAGEGAEKAPNVNFDF